MLKPKRKIKILKWAKKKSILFVDYQYFVDKLKKSKFTFSSSNQISIPSLKFFISMPLQASCQHFTKRIETLVNKMNI